MQNDARKAAITAYKERKNAPGLFLITCSPTQERWLGHAPDLATIRNRIWFTLRNGTHRHASLQAAWGAHGEAQFGFEEVERLSEDDLAPGYDRVMKARLEEWCARSGAQPL
ncbi:GIY-YIG nuclease family protein [Bosea sp. TND4EK4]|uniref:GIY-YIG nuclease family protein n=1 Tax=Bosea sp. TND4EK4 TaxID=1907408 RepID=UPI000955D31A|nr:GIY-YIG nuclease family protein [Bosea sp. TND4EK4]SIQ08624.1 hypothetical protein SAMN05880592_101855 [Bosea sp. TND4EK4]